ncbi:MAG: InlB B-repeat-containing protein, partial [Treponema sp.]|nr:InlB B-repeat-containing protein [Treponema sp.]
MATLFHGPKPEEPVPVFTIVFDANGATGAAPSAQTAESGTVITMPGEGGLSKGAHVFTGWNISKSGGGTTYPPESPYTVTADQTFYAQWTDPAQVYTVTYNANGAGGTPPSPQKAVQNGSIIVADKGNLANANKNFAGWNTAADGMGTNYTAGAAFTVTANITLYAQWVDPSVQRYTVTYYANGASGTPPSAQTVNEGASITLPGAGGLTYSGKTFTGWNT